MTVRVVSWNAFNAYWKRSYKQSEHVIVIGPTGSGKTVLMRELVKPRKYKVATGVKYKDDSLQALITDDGWKRVKDWSHKPKGCSSVVLWPNEKRLDKVKVTQQRAFRKMFNDIYINGGWCILIDELRVMSDILALKSELQHMYVAARSNNISLLAGGQRPRHMPLEAYSQSSHMFLFRTGDETDLARMGGLNGNNAKQVAATVADLPHHTFLYVNLLDGTQVISRYEMKGK